MFLLLTCCFPLPSSLQQGCGGSCSVHIIIMLRPFRVSLYPVREMQMSEPERESYPSVLPSPLSQMRMEMGPCDINYSTSPAMPAAASKNPNPRDSCGQIHRIPSQFERRKSLHVFSSIESCLLLVPLCCPL